ncbi:hypothetical protein [Amycolatopsis sp. NPDC003731]
MRAHAYPGFAGSPAGRHEATGWAAMPAGQPMTGARPTAASREPESTGAPADRREAAHLATGRQPDVAQAAARAGAALRSSR